MDALLGLVPRAARWSGSRRGQRRRRPTRARRTRSESSTAAASGPAGKTCDELGHDPVLFEKLKDAVKRWPDAGGGEAIPDVCGFDATIAWDADQTVDLAPGPGDPGARGSLGGGRRLGLLHIAADVLGLRPAPENSELGGGREADAVGPLLVLRRLVLRGSGALSAPARAAHFLSRSFP